MPKTAIQNNHITLLLLLVMPGLDSQSWQAANLTMRLAQRCQRPGDPMSKPHITANVRNNS